MSTEVKGPRIDIIETANEKNNGGWAKKTVPPALTDHETGFICSGQAVKSNGLA